MNPSLLDGIAPLAAGAVTFLTALLCMQARAAGQADAATSALLDKIDAARGAPQAKPPHSLRIEGTYAVVFDGAPGGKPVAQGAFRESFVGDDMARHTSDMGKMGKMERGIIDDLVWEVDPAMGAKIQRGAHAAAVRRYFALLRGTSPRQIYEQWQALDAKVIDGREHTVLRMVAAEGKPDLWYVDADGNVSRVDMALPTPESADAAFDLDDRLNAQITFADWKAVAGVRYPHRRSLRMGPATVNFVCTEITVPAEIDAATFVPPAAVAKVKVTTTEPAFGPDGKPTYQIVEREEQAVASIRIQCKPDEISAKLAELLSEVMAHLNATGATMAGAPFSRYHALGETLDLEAGIPVHKPITEKGRVKNSKLPAGRTVTCWHVGPYHELHAAHTALQAYLAQAKLTARGGPWEVYWTDPGMVPDPAKWRTQIFAPIE